MAVFIIGAAVLFLAVGYVVTVLARRHAELFDSVLAFQAEDFRDRHHAYVLGEIARLERELGVTDDNPTCESRWPQPERR